jgi:hypothetical protein
MMKIVAMVWFETGTLPAIERHLSLMNRAKSGLENETRRFPERGAGDSSPQAKNFLESRGYFYAFLLQIKYKISLLAYT